MAKQKLLGFESEVKRKSYSQTVMATCHPDRKHCAKGLCGSCYQLQFVSSQPVTNCPHTDQPHAGRGMCKKCYMQWYFKERAAKGNLKKERKPITACQHITRRHFADGMCKTCHTERYKKASNSALGYVDDDIPRLEGLIEYLKAYKNRQLW